MRREPGAWIAVSARGIGHALEPEPEPEPVEKISKLSVEREPRAATHGGVGGVDLWGGSVARFTGFGMWGRWTFTASNLSRFPLILGLRSDGIQRLEIFSG